MKTMSIPTMAGRPLCPTSSSSSKYLTCHYGAFSVVSVIAFPKYRGLPALTWCKIAIFSYVQVWGVASLPHKCQPPLPSARQHPRYGYCLEVKREYYQNCSVLGCVTHCSQSAAHSCEQFLQVQQIGFVTFRPLCHA